MANDLKADGCSDISKAFINFEFWTQDSLLFVIGSLFLKFKILKENLGCSFLKLEIQVSFWVLSFHFVVFLRLLISFKLLNARQLSINYWNLISFSWLRFANLNNQWLFEVSFLYLMLFTLKVIFGCLISFFIALSVPFSKY